MEPHISHNKFFEVAKSIFERINDGFWNAVGSAIAVAIGTFIGTYYGGLQTNAIVTEKTGQVVDSIIEKSIEKSVETTTNLSDARAMEIEGFIAMTEKDLDRAISSFLASDSIYPQYHASYEIANYLKANRDKSSEPDFWDKVYNYVNKEFWGYIPRSLKDSFSTK